MQEAIRALAFYLPQYHPVAENDAWWGKGFTEWRNVTKAKPLFPGHYQPHLPGDLGFYDLRVEETRQAQADLARQHGIGGFVYYHYWFNGRRILERPFQEVLASGKPELPFCLCWANENWTRAWDGGERDILLGQNYGPEDDLAHVQSLLPAFQDERYIKVDGRPLVLIYRTELLPDPAQTAGIWRQAARAAGFPDLYLVRVEHFTSGVDPASIGFDAAVEFAPDNRLVGPRQFADGFAGFLGTIGLLPKALKVHHVFRYSAVARAMASRGAASYKRFRCVTPMWDNSARRKENARIFVGSTPGLYEQWLATSARKTMAEFKGDERMIFINAWNEWAEGNHLEPDLKWGTAYLEATARALRRAVQVSETQESATLASPDNRPATAGVFRSLYWKVRLWLTAQREVLSLALSKRT